MVEAEPGRLNQDLSRPGAPLVPSAVIGTLVFVFSEIMMFSALISALTIARSATPTWPPPGQARLPIEATAFNTVVLVASAIFLLVAARRFKVVPDLAKRPFLLAMLTGAFFVCFQGFEWVRLIGEGLTLTSSTHGSFFYLIVGAHALHVAAGLVVLSVAFMRLRRNQLDSSYLAATQVFWVFVVALWPVLYLRVYL